MGSKTSAEGAHSGAAVVKVLLNRYGTTFSEDLHIDIESNTPSSLFALLIAALLSSARISSGIAFKSARILLDRGWTSSKILAATTWEQRVQALDEGGYVRYDERTFTMLGETAELVENLYQGDLRKLRQAAGEDPVRERKLLRQFKGIGDVGVDIFFREAQLAWRELYPFADKKALTNAELLGLPSDARRLAALARGERGFLKLVAALVKVGLERKHDEVLAEATGR